LPVFQHGDEVAGHGCSTGGCSSCGLSALHEK
jgi:hypothetical protein